MTNKHKFYIFSFHNIYMFFNVIETNSYCAAYFLFITKKYWEECMRDFFYLKNIYNSYIKTIIKLKVYIYLFIVICKCKKKI